MHVDDGEFPALDNLVLSKLEYKRIASSITSGILNYLVIVKYIISL